MDTLKASDKITVMEKAYVDINKGQSAEATLRILDPLVDSRLGQLLSEFGRCPPDLAALLDLRAKINEVWRIRDELNKMKKLGVSAAKLLEAVTSTSGNRTNENLRS